MVLSTEIHKISNKYLWRFCSFVFVIVCSQTMTFKYLFYAPQQT